MDSPIFDHLDPEAQERFRTYVQMTSPLTAARAFVKIQQKNQNRLQEQRKSFATHLQDPAAASPNLTNPTIIPTITPIPKSQDSTLYNEFSQITISPSPGMQSNTEELNILQNITVAAQTIHNIMIDNPSRLNKGDCSKISDNIEIIVNLLDQEKTRIHTIKAKYNQLLQDIQTQNKMLELIRENHQHKIEKVKLEVQLEEQRNRETDIKHLIQEIYRKSSITAEQMNSVLDKSTNHITEAFERTETHFRNTIHWH